MKRPLLTPSPTNHPHELQRRGLDRIGRVFVATGLLGVGYRFRDSTPGALAFIGGSDLLATAVIGRCPVNELIGLDTCEME
ncbi:YgaP family membrane protein [Halovivax gelatinilyticus]|uniref:YgaP family membrane protein n=1 Tax=Halovivax gelatinilyticus TaxID=2961597 RepID=UPI0020CA4DE3|nr:DUF2892 domain-containing protein [Halovivax gelatinilyticus]